MTKSYITKTTKVVGHFGYRLDGDMYLVIHIPSRIGVARFHTESAAIDFIERASKIDKALLPSKSWVDWEPIRSKKILELTIEIFNKEGWQRGNAQGC